jgi:hypothetical protein
MRSFACVVASAAVVAVGSAGCSSGNKQPTSQQYDDVAQSTAAIVASPAGGASGGGEIGSMANVATLSAGGSTAGVSVTASGSFSGVVGGITYDFTLTCTDSSGAALPHCGSTTNTATASVSWTGDVSVAGYSASVNRSGNWTVTGIQSGTATFNGSGSLTYQAQFTSAFNNTQASTDLSYSGSYDAVTYNETSHVVTGGTIHYTVSGSGQASSNSGQASGSFTVDAVVTFNGSGGATITLDGTHTYNVTSGGVVIKV